MRFSDLSGDLKSESTNLIPHESGSKDAFSKTFVRKQRTIGLKTASSFLLGSIIGAGIFVTPAGVLRYTGSPGGSLLVWCCSGLIAALGAFVYLELAITFPQSGSDFIYIRTCWGELPAFLYMWIQMVVVSPALIAIKALTFANYVLEPLFPQCIVPQNGIRLVAVIVICK